MESWLGQARGHDASAHRSGCVLAGPGPGHLLRRAAEEGREGHLGDTAFFRQD